MGAKAIEIKKTEVQNILNKINESEATVVIKYDGLTVDDLTTLRTSLRNEDVELAVLKNNITKRAFQEANFDGMDDLFKGPTAVAFSKNDVTAAARILNDFSKKNDNLVLKGGTYEKNVANLDEVKELASLPNKEGMLSMLLSVLQAPVRGLAQVTSQIAESKDE